MTLRTGEAYQVPPRCCSRGDGAPAVAEAAMAQGEWQEGARWGQGECVFADGSEYSGQWRNGRPNGRGVWRYAPAARQPVQERWFTCLRMRALQCLQRGRAAPRRV